MERKLVRRFFAVSGILFVALAVAPSLLDAGATSQPTDKFEIYCDGIAIFLERAEGAAHPGRLVLFHKMPTPGGPTIYLPLLPEKWLEVFVLQGGCLPDWKCTSVGTGKLWLDQWDKETTVAGYLSRFQADTKLN